MTKPATQVLKAQERVPEWLWHAVLVVGGSLLVALCAQVSIPLPFTPVPLTLQDFAVLLVGLSLGSRRGFAALALYLIEGASGLPVFSPASPLGPSGIAHLVGPTGGFLLAYPFVAGLAGWIFEQGKKTFARAAVAGLLADVLLFAGGLGWLAVLTHSFARAMQFGLYWFVFGQVIKIMVAAAITSGWQRARNLQP